MTGQLTPHQIIQISAGIPAALGILFTTIGLLLRFSRYRKSHCCTEQTMGKVVEMIHENNGADSDFSGISGWHPVFAYTVNGQNFRKESHYGRSKSKFSEGQDIEILYDPRLPDRYFVPEEHTELVFNILTAVGGTLLTAAFLIDAFLCVLL